MSPYKYVGIFFLLVSVMNLNTLLHSEIYFFFCLGLLMWAGCGQPVGSETDDPAAPGSMHS